VVFLDGVGRKAPNAIQKNNKITVLDLSANNLQLQAQLEGTRFIVKKENQGTARWRGLLVIVVLLFGMLIAGCQSSRAGASYRAETTFLPTLAATVEKTPGPSATRAQIIRTPTLMQSTATPIKPISEVSSILTPTAPPGSVYYPPGRINVPILLYHNVSNRGSTRYIVRTAQFRAQMKALHTEGYQTITISQLADVIRSGGYLPEKPVVITFDDGYLSVHQNAFPILEEFGFQAVVYIISGTVATDKSYGYMQKAEVDDLVAAGWEIGSHSISHSSLKATPLGLRSEIEKSKQELEEKLDVEIRSFSYPYNITNDSIKGLVETYGYESAVGVDLFVIHSPDRLYFLSRREVYSSTTIKEFNGLLIPGKYETATETVTVPAETP
jgi:peptidoglycan/xylan/chitin deacetylase (PgdA/CDA1 family)